MKLLLFAQDLLFQQSLEELAGFPSFEPKLYPYDALEDHIFIPLMVALELVIRFFCLLLIEIELLSQQLGLFLEDLAHVLPLFDVLLVLFDVDRVVD